MPKSEFFSPVQVISGRVFVEGPGDLIAPPGDPEFRIHWLVEQGGRIASGLTDGLNGGGPWTDSAPAPPEWEDGSVVVVVGLVVGLSADGSETFAWRQELPLQVLESVEETPAQ